MIKVPPMTVACDVTNPLLGPAGATAVFGPQKGVLESAFSRLEGALKHLAGVMECDPEFPGAGAAGGLGYGLRYFCDAEMVSGFDLVAEALCLKERIKEVDLVITGEGSLDEQTLDGKGPAGVALMARKMGKRVIGVAGQVADEARPLFDEAYALSELQLPLEELMANAAFLLEHLVKDKVVL
jgi:glycerate kinase